MSSHQPRELCDIAAPQNVRLIRDGHPIPVDCAYAGTTADGVDMWEVLDYTIDLMTDQLQCDELPAKCGIMVATRGETIFE